MMSIDGCPKKNRQTISPRVYPLVSSREEPQRWETMICASSQSRGTSTAVRVEVRLTMTALLPPTVSVFSVV
jgi:hypothetical protein